MADCGSASSRFHRSSGLPLLVDDGTSAYLHAGGVRARIDGSNAVAYPLADGLGSVRGTTDGTGALTGTDDYAAFGDVRSQSGAASIFGFTGEQTDPSGQLYLRARTYDPALGRFMSADTVQPNAPGSQGYNRYAYVANNPATWTDPSGHEATIWTVAAGLASSVALFALGAIQQAARQTVPAGAGGVLLSGRELTRTLPLMTPIITALTGVFGASYGFLLAPDFVSRLVSAALFVISTILIGTLFYLLAEMFILLDPFDFFPDARAPDKAVTYSSETIRGASTYYPNSPQYRNCSTGTVLGGAAEEYIWGAALGVFGGGETSGEDILLSAGLACFAGRPGGGGPSPDLNIYKGKTHSPNWPGDGFQRVQNGLKYPPTKNKALLQQLKAQHPGRWRKVYENGWLDGRKVSVHYFFHDDGSVFDVKVVNHWS